MRIQERSVIIALGILLNSSLVVAQDNSWDSAPSGGFYDAEQPPPDEESTVPEEEVAYPINDDDKSNTFGVLSGYALDFETLPYNPYGFVFGVRGGHTLDFGLYLGVKLSYYAGQMHLMQHQNELTADFELGYDFDADAVLVRTSIDVGIETRKELFHLAPGGTIMFPFEDYYFVGFDARYLIVFDSDPIQGLSLLGSIGIRY